MPGAEDSVILKLKIELEESEQTLRKYKARLNELKREKTKDTKTERIEFQRRTGEEAKQHRIKLNQIKELRAARRIENSVWLKDLSKIPEQLGQKYQAWARRNPEAAAMFRGVRTGGKIIGRPVMAAARLGVGVAASGATGLLGMLIGAIQQGYQTYLQVGQAMGGVAGMGAGKGLHKAIGKGIGLGHRPTETWLQAAQVGRATGVPEAVTMAQKFALHGGGMQVGEAAGIMGQLRQAGVEFGGPNRAGASQLLGKMVEKGLITGLEKARLPEYLKGVSSMAEMVGGRQAGKVDVDTIATTLSYLGRIPGMQGQRGVNLMQTIDQAIKAPGGGEAGQQLMLQAMGFGKPGGETPYYEAVKRQQRGITGIGGAQNLIDVFKEIQSQYGPLGKGSSSQEANLAAQTAMPGLTLDMIESIGEMINSGKSQEEILKGIEEATKKFKPIEDRVVDAIDKGFLSVRVRLASQEAKSAGIGAKFAGTVEKIQDTSYKLLSELIKMLKPILPDIHQGIVAMGQWATRMLREVGEKVRDVKAVMPTAGAVYKAMGGGAEGVAAAALISYKMLAEKYRQRELAGKYSGIPMSRIEKVKALEEEESKLPTPSPLDAPGVAEQVKKRREAIRKQKEALFTKGLTPAESAEYKKEMEGFRKRYEKEETEKAKTAPTKTEKAAPTSSIADPFATAGEGLAALEKTGPANTRYVTGIVRIPISSLSRLRLTGTPGGGEGETIG